MKTKKLTLSGAVCCFCAVALLLALCDAFLPYREEKIYSGLIRLHIIANSDAEADQNVKLAVRDEMTALSEKYLSSCLSLEEAKERLEEISGILTDAADSVIRENGFCYTSRAVMGKERYDTRTYDGISFPGGEYLSFRLILGSGEGKNWWCVLFPPLCLSAASAEKELADIGIDSETQKTFTSDKPKYRFKFKLLEWLFG